MECGTLLANARLVPVGGCVSDGAAGVGAGTPPCDAGMDVAGGPPPTFTLYLRKLNYIFNALVPYQATVARYMARYYLPR